MVYKYPQLEGELYEKVQLSNVFDDPKTFIDAIPLGSYKSISELYNKSKSKDTFDLAEFINKNFKILATPQTIESVPQSKLPIEDYIDITWERLKKDVIKNYRNSSFISLPYSFVVAGGRFQEIYYWDSFFSSLGLIQSGKIELVFNMCRDFAHLINKYGFIPNGNRKYYISRSQPPVFALLVNLINSRINIRTQRNFLEALEKEYDFWMKGKKSLKENGNDIKRVARLEPKVYLNKYYDELSIPRPEGYTYDFLSSIDLTESEKKYYYKNIRAGAESGWDFSSRWFKDYLTLQTIRTTDILPIDLNCLLYNTEITLSNWMEHFEFPGKAKYYKKLAFRRKNAINKYMWNEKKGFYFDYSLSDDKQTKCYSLASIYPLFFEIADMYQAQKIEKIIREEFLFNGGLVTTLNKTDQQWDYPNGWAPLQWLAVRGLEKYGFNQTANEIKKRWLALCLTKYEHFGKLYEKYDVVNTQDDATAGEYGIQEGFGWTNGVYLDLLKNSPSTVIFND